MKIEITIDEVTNGSLIRAKSDHFNLAAIANVGLYPAQREAKNLLESIIDREAAYAEPTTEEAIS